MRKIAGTTLGQVHSHGVHSGAVPPNFVVPRKFFIETYIKTKNLTPKNVFCPQNLKICSGPGLGGS